MMSFSQKKYLRTALLISAIIASYFLLGIISAYFTLRDTTKYSLIFSILLGYVMYPLLNKVLDFIDAVSDPTLRVLEKDLKSSKRGMDGEKEVSLWMEEIVGKDNFIRNVKIPGYLFDFDIIAFSSKGLIILEVKNLSNEVRFNDDFFIEENGRFRRMQSQRDLRQLFNWQVNLLNDFLRQNGYDTLNVSRALVFSNGKVSWTGSTGMYIAKDKDSLRRYIDRLPDDSASTPVVMDSLRALLS